MGALTEIEIFDQLATSLGDAIDCADELASRNEKGPAYDRLRRCLKLVEGCCRQASAWREDTRWLSIARMMAEAHQKAGGWLRGYKDPDSGVRIHFAEGQKNKLFSMFADNLRSLRKVVDDLRTKATGRAGMILPAPLPFHREHRPLGWTPPKRPAILLPPGYAGGGA